eukprot:3050699-Amphidinium_carterae.1
MQEQRAKSHTDFRSAMLKCMLIQKTKNKLEHIILEFGKQFCNYAGTTQQFLTLCLEAKSVWPVEACHTPMDVLSAQLSCGLLVVCMAIGQQTSKTLMKLPSQSGTHHHER